VTESTDGKEEPCVPREEIPYAWLGPDKPEQIIQNREWKDFFINNSHQEEKARAIEAVVLGQGYLKIPLPDAPPESIEDVFGFTPTSLDPSVTWDSPKGGMSGLFWVFGQYLYAYCVRSAEESK
jgi:hypothetical protein